MFGIRYVSLPVRGAWIEMLRHLYQYRARFPSLPVRGAWIEIAMFFLLSAAGRVAPRAGSVD